MERCHACNRQFGLIRHRWWGYHFCTKKCLNDFLVKRTQQIERLKEWLGSPDREASQPLFITRLIHARRQEEKSICPRL
jgi:hypothetical protein